MMQGREHWCVSLQVPKLLHPNYDDRMELSRILICSDSGLDRESRSTHTPAGRQAGSLAPPLFMAYHLSFLAPQWLCRQAGGRPECQQISAARSATTQNKTKTQRHVIIDLIFMFPVFNSGLSVGGYHIYLYICRLQFNSRLQPREGGREGRRRACIQ